MTHTFDYCSNLVYEDGELSFLLTPAGRAIPTEQEHEYVYEYFLRDHLGNIRVVFGDPDRDHEAEVIQENHYYPFGMTMGGLNFAAGLENRYLYQGKETTGDFNLWWSDFHARRFDSQLGRWHVPDPAGQFASPYVGMGNNPVNSIDPTGMYDVGTLGQYYRMRQSISAYLDRQLEDYYDWIDMFSARYGFMGNIISWNPNMRIGGGGTTTTSSEGQGSGNDNGVDGIINTPNSQLVVSSDDGGQEVSSKPSKGEYIVYSGEWVNWFDANDYLMDSYDATSGNFEFQNSSKQNVENRGPIPEGKYSIDLSLNPYRFASVIEWSGELYSADGIQRIAPSYTLSDGRIATYEGWGDIRARLNYISGETYDRPGNYYIHNSHKGYTHGCIEVGGNFFSRLINYSQYYSSIFLYVSYLNNNTSTLGNTYHP